MLIVDARPLDAFVLGHIPEAKHIDLVSPKFGIRSQEDLQGFHIFLRDALAMAGLAGANVAVVYDAGMETRAARTAWMLEYAGFEVAILRGGFATWQRQNRAVSQVRDRIEPSDVSVFPRRDVLATAEEVALAMRDGRATIIDARNNKEYQGDPGTRSGHIPGAFQIEWKRVMGLDGYKHISDLGGVFKGVPKDKPVIVYCQSGARSAALYHTMREAGYSVKNYLGSMNEWLADPNLPLELGPEKRPQE